MTIRLLSKPSSFDCCLRCVACCAAHLPDVNSAARCATRLGSRQNTRFGKKSIGILLTNLGTPDAPTPNAVRRYLAEFLRDPRVVKIPRPLWWLILQGYILPFRSRLSAKNYQKIWTEQGSPLLVHSRQLAQKLQNVLQTRTSHSIRVALGMRYGTPSITQGLQELHTAHNRRILLLPLYPQYSSTTTASTFDAVCKTLGSWPQLPEFRAINHYADHPGYIGALVDIIQAHWQHQGMPEQLLFSFHGLPKSFVANDGDPYEQQCRHTAQLIATKLGLQTQQWQVVFQSRFSRSEWLQPYCDHTLQKLAREGHKKVDVICPGFPVDCLETLEEIAIRNTELYCQAGGEQLRYIPALNTSDRHVEMLANLVMNQMEGW